MEAKKGDDVLAESRHPKPLKPLDATLVIVPITYGGGRVRGDKEWQDGLLELMVQPTILLIEKGVGVGVHLKSHLPLEPMGIV